MEVEIGVSLLVAIAFPSIIKIKCVEFIDPLRPRKPNFRKKNFQFKKVSLVLFQNF